VVAVFTSLVDVLVAVTFTPGITAPPGSDTVPRISAVLTCAEARLAEKKNIAARIAESTATERRFILSPLFVRKVGLARKLSPPRVNVKGPCGIGSWGDSVQMDLFHSDPIG